MFDYETLKLIWWAIIGVLMIGFMVTDGMDMGVGTLLPFVGKTDDERRVVINTVGAHWDGNQVWFITLGGALFAAWPLVYATAFSGFYFAMMLTLFALFLRPLGFDYRSKLDNPRWRGNWDWALFVGSSVPPLVFGVAFGNLLQGVPFHFDDLMRVSYTGSFLALFNPFALLCGVVSVAMVTMHGGAWLVMRTEQVVAERAAKIGMAAALVLVVAFVFAGVCIWLWIPGFHVVGEVDISGVANPTLKQVELAQAAWLQNYNLYPLMWLFPAAGVTLALVAMVLMKLGKGALAFIATSVANAGVILTAGASMFPFVMPSSSVPNHSLTLWDAVSSEMTLNLMLIAVILLLPFVLGYTIWCYYKMWRRVTVAEITEHSHSTY
ncbi:cytochrome d ubiquinol oxidase subunit II [Motilimonas eburnea]|uniref:cytochrome d ubiquinol oxidase subunit II n=1 Tax=Motilimonas eburnea TaxID=1737488 RepID=UPI001E32FAEC|nr:cytochrome d ubiquinol oxidase subunit II [Motilimonas eburnea]MCE2573251.1 cytochrome d ubiquinol oxidase subunit II [Motilimonas eburnea]